MADLTFKANLLPNSDLGKALGSENQRWNIYGKFAHTPNNTTTFLRGDNTFSNILTGNIYTKGYYMEQANSNSSVTNKAAIYIWGDIAAFSYRDSANNYLGDAFYYNINNGDITAKHEVYITNGNLSVGTAEETTNQRRITLNSGSGDLTLFSNASATGSRGLWVSAHGTGAGKNIITIDTNNNATFTGNASSATTLQTARTIQTNLGSTSSASFNGSANITPGITGTLSIAHGGTSATTYSSAQTNLQLYRNESYISASNNTSILNNIKSYISSGTTGGWFGFEGGSGRDAPNTNNVWWNINWRKYDQGNAVEVIATQYSNNSNIFKGTAWSNNTSAPTWNRIWCSGNSVTGAVWNDYAEYRESHDTEFGYVVQEIGDDTLRKTTKRLDHFAGVTSDTWGFAQRKKKKAKTPIAVAGRVLVYPGEDKNKYQPGDCVCAGPDGKVYIMTREEIKEWPDRIVGTVSCVPTYDEWGGGENADRPSVKVNGRIWIKVR